MGTWDAGVFDNDSALDHVCEFTSKMIQEIDDAVSDPSELECDEYWGDAMPAHIEMLLCLHRDTHGLLPKPDKAVHWRDTYLRVWDGYIDNLDPKPEYKTKRREVLVSLFDRLNAAANAAHNGG
ncbi:DUF4259 domain-containing protein [Rhodopirellula sp. MGV]|uniref:DUF4259 domain-containing protein n=1 Tax=Rhodopirellula sp. MGV TaxID=2023130 RepID=UPI000B970B1E|nr:DUF4259 domain-containing protein [Rhodopirellula sp. MGV]OYP37138.1 hypothetical protein CGZ80_06010 [Rhodopirellula sp. MGV]PNY35632.1 DUF4259 domain-containing protein [Rhodopirellula baltica]